MTSRRKFVLFGVDCSFGDTESTSDEELARSLASDSSRASAVAHLESSRVLLLSWTAQGTQPSQFSRWLWPSPRTTPGTAR